MALGSQVNLSASAIHVENTIKIMLTNDMLQTVRKRCPKFVDSDAMDDRLLFLRDKLCKVNSFSCALSEEFIQCRNDVITYFLAMEHCLFVCYDLGLSELDSPHVSRPQIAANTWLIDSSLAKSDQFQVYVRSNIDWVLYVPRIDVVAADTFLRIDYSDAAKICGVLLNSVNAFLTPMGWSGEYVLFAQKKGAERTAPGGTINGVRHH